MTATGESVRITKRVKAPVGKVYRAFIEPEQLERWMHPDDFETPSAQNDPKVGGAGEVIHAQAGKELGGFRWQYTEMVPDCRLVMDCYFFMFDEDPGEGRSRLTIELHEVEADVTEVTLIHDRLGEAPPGGHAGVDSGWTQALDELGRHLESDGSA